MTPEPPAGPTGAERLVLARPFLDLLILDADFTECGRVDDVEIEFVEGAWKVTALLVGLGAGLNRLPRRIAQALKPFLGRVVVRVPVGAIERVDGRIHLRARAAELGLGGGDRTAEL